MDGAGRRRTLECKICTCRIDAKPRSITSIEGRSVGCVIEACLLSGFYVLEFELETASRVSRSSASRVRLSFDWAGNVRLLNMTSANASRRVVAIFTTTNKTVWMVR